MPILATCLAYVSLWRAFFSRKVIGRLFFYLFGVAVFLICPQNSLAASTNASNTVTLDPIYSVGSWIWSATTLNQQQCLFWRDVDIPANARVVKAFLRLTADNSYSLYLDGRELGRGGEWRNLTEYDITLLLDPGKHIIAVDAYNDSAQAGVLGGLVVELADGKKIEIGTDSSWKIVPTAERGWKTRTRPSKDWPQATVLGPFLSGFWRSRPSHIVQSIQFQPIAYHFWQSGWFLFSVLSLCVIALGICLRLMSKLAAQAQAERAVQRERARMARDIHDDLTAGLTQLTILGNIVSGELPLESELRGRVDQLCEKARALSRSMNEIIWAVNSERDTIRDFTSYTCKYAETFMQTTPIRCRFEIEENLPNFHCDWGMRRNLFLATKEALNNVVCHSGATEATLRITRQGEEIIISIEDNGKGFDPLNTTAERNGLSNMVKRASDAMGTCRILSQPGCGCRIQFILPVGRPLKPLAEKLETARKETFNKAAKSSLSRT